MSNFILHFKGCVNTYPCWDGRLSWGPSQNNTPFELLTLCDRNPEDFPHKGSVMWSCVFFAVSLKKLLSKQSSCQWYMTPWCLCDVIIMLTLLSDLHPFAGAEWYRRQVHLVYTGAPAELRLGAAQRNSSTLNTERSPHLGYLFHFRIVGVGILWKSGIIGYQIWYFVNPTPLRLFVG